jgi:hypothetical protein
LHHIAVVQNANLSFTRGLIWLEDVHYNAEKFGQHNQREHTFTWDNVGFDGPVLARDLTFDVVDAVSPVANYPGQVNLGWSTQPGAGPQLPIPGVTGIENAAAALVTFNFFHYDAPSAITYVLNGRSHTAAWPYPDKQAGTWRTLALPVALSDVVAGTNTVSIWSDRHMALANVDLLLVGAGPTVGVRDSESASVAATPTPVPPATIPPTPEPTRPPQAAVVGGLLPNPAHAPVNLNGADVEAGQISLRVPAGVVGSGGGELNVLPLDPESVPARAASPQMAKTAFVVTLTDLGTRAQISQPSSPLVLHYHLSQVEIDESSGDLSRFQIVNWSGDDWVPLACTTDAADLDCSVPHLGLFALVLAP